MHLHSRVCLVCVTMVSLMAVTSCADINGHTRTHIKGPIYYIPPHTQHPHTRTHTNMKGLAGLTVRCHLTSCCLLCGHIVIITCGVQCNTCLGCFWGVLHPPIVQMYPPISVSEAAAPPIRMMACMQSQSVFNSNYYQTVIQMQVYCNGMQYNCFK